MLGNTMRKQQNKSFKCQFAHFKYYFLTQKKQYDLRVDNELILNIIVTTESVRHSQQKQNV